jgi:putative phage-type endonuclease
MTLSENRQSGIGASEAAAAIGLGPRMQLWAQKTGRLDPPNLDEVEAVQWGKLLESVIVQTFGERTGRKVDHNDTADMIWHRDYPWMFATPDAIQESDKFPDIGILEAKNVGSYLAADWRDDPPLQFQVQLQHQLEVMDASWGSLCALIGGNHFRWFDAERNPRFISTMIEKEQEFWTLVVSDTPPPPDGSIATTETLKRLYPKDDGEIVNLPLEAEQWDRDRLEYKAVKKEAEEKIRAAENRIKGALGPATTGVLSDGTRYTFKQQVVHYKAKEAYTSRYRVLRRKKG